METSGTKANKNQQNSVFNQRASSLTAGPAAGGIMIGVPTVLRQKNKNIYAQYGLMGHERTDQKISSSRGS